MPAGVFRAALKASAAHCALAFFHQAEAFSLFADHPTAPSPRTRAAFMHDDDELVLRMTKEVIIKFIELGRVSPGNFDAQFKSIFWTIKKTAVDAQCPDLKDLLPSVPRADGEES
jgi:hypothetical protein